MAANIFEFPIANPLKPIWQAIRMPSDATSVKYQAFNPSYNYKPYNNDFLYNSFKSWVEREKYCQPFQQSDTVRLQFFTPDNTPADYTVELLNENGIPYTLKTVSASLYAGTFNSLYLYTITMSCWDIPEGKYFLRIRYDHGSSVYSYIVFEPIHIKQIHPNTGRINYKNSFNDQSVIYYTELPGGAITTYFEFEYQLRVNLGITEIAPNSKFNVYEDQPLNAELVHGVKFNEYIVEFGVTGMGIPEWMAEKLEAVFLCDTLSIDGRKFTRSEGSKLERNGNDVLSKYTIRLRDRENRTTDNYNINMVSMGVLPKTSCFWVESMTTNSVARTIRKKFNGKRNFLDYLNSEQVLLAARGYYSEDAKGNLVFIADDNTSTLSGTWTLSIVLQYAFKFRIKGQVSVEVSIDAPAAGTSYYAVHYGDGSSSVNRASYTTQLIIKSYTDTKEKELCIFVDRCEEFNDVDTALINGSVLGIGGDLPPTILVYNISINGLGISRMDNNMFRFMAGANLDFTLDLQNLNTNSVDEIIRYTYDARDYLGATTEIDISGNTPAARPTQDLGNSILLGTIRGLINLFTTD